jgi:hypothetical protein
MKTLSMETVPMISVNQFAKYMVEKSPLEREKILLSAKYPDPNGAPPALYSKAKSSIKEFLLNNHDRRILEDCRSEILAQVIGSKQHWRATNKKYSLEILKSILSMELNTLKNFVAIEFTEKHSPIIINGVGINIYPDLLFKKQVGSNTRYGGIKLYLSGKSAMEPEVRKVVAYLLHRFLQTRFTNSDVIADSKMCFAYDVNSSELDFAPTNNINRLKYIEAACLSIRAIWDHISEPHQVLEFSPSDT